MEAASHLSMLGVCKSVSVIGQSRVAYLNSLGREVGEVLQKLVEDQGVAFHMEEEVTELRGEKEVKEVSYPLNITCRGFSRVQFLNNQIHWDLKV